MNIGWEDWRVFLAVAETRSMSAAAKQLRVGQPTVSRRLQALEGELGYAVFERSVTGVALTSAGERLVSPAQKMAEWADELDRAASAGTSRPEGVVRVTAAPGLAYEFLAPFAAWLSHKQPGLRLEVRATVAYLDLVRGEADLALRRLRPDDSELSTVATLKYETAVFVSRRYRSKPPKRPALELLRWVAWAPPYDDVPPNPQLRELIPGFTPAFTSDNYLIMRRAAEAGVGAWIFGRMQSRHALPSLLRPVDADLGPHTNAEMHLVCARRALEIPRVRAMAELLAEEMRLARPG